MKQKLLAFFALALMAALPASADIEVDGLFYSVYNNEAIVTGQVNGGQNPGGDLVIPDTVDIYGRIYPVTAIGTNAFHSDNITSVDIPRTITKMYFGAFINCNKIQSPKSITGLLSTVSVLQVSPCPTRSSRLVLRRLPTARISRASSFPTRSTPSALSRSGHART